MKKLLVGLLALGSVSVFANPNAGVLIKKVYFYTQGESVVSAKVDFKTSKGNYSTVKSEDSTKRCLLGETDEFNNLEFNVLTRNEAINNLCKSLQNHVLTSESCDADYRAFAKLNGNYFYLKALPEVLVFELEDGKRTTFECN